MTPTLEGPRLRLEPLTLAHLPALEAIAFDPQIWRYMLHRIETPADLRTWAEAALKLEAAGTGLPWVTILKSTQAGEPDRLIGSTRFIDLDLHHKTVEIGNTWLAPNHHGTGINPEAKLLQLDYAFNVLALNRVAFKTHHENLQSQAAIRKLGATHEGTFRNHYLMPDGSHRHSIWFSIIREEWPAVRANLITRLQSQPN
jgi:RimJ/RimL family protein N-acetyltransferase